MIGAAFYPRKVVVRLSDFKTNEYSALIGGKYFESKEENPMLGFRGASRYIHPSFQQAFALECQALNYVRNVMGLTNISVMIPFCRTVKEAKEVIALMHNFGLSRLNQHRSDVPEEDEPLATRHLHLSHEQETENHHRLSNSSLDIYMMCEIPNNVLCLDEFLNIFDGISIGSNDLTQLILGIDRDSSILAQSFDEREKGVKMMISMAVQGSIQLNTPSSS
jgi:pyruvate,water dikinase